MEEGFPYPAGTGLASDGQWLGSSGSSVSVVSGNLTLTNLAATGADTNMLQITGGTSRTVYRNFSSNAVTGGSVYYSALICCTLPPTNSQFITSLMDAGNTSPNRDTDPLDLYVTTVTNGYRLSVISAGSDSATIRQTLAVNTTHFIVLRYDFGSTGQGTLYVDPTPGGVEPSSPSARTSGGDGGAGASNLQIVLFRSASSVGQGSFNFDTLRIGTNWADVTPLPTPLSLKGPDDQVVCYGSGVSFNVLASGTAPFTYQWRTNGVAVPNTNTNAYTLGNPGIADTLNLYDVVVTDAFGSLTSQVARLFFTTNAAAIVIQPTSQLVTSGISNVTFSVTASGDAPLSFQWRTNGLSIHGATNSSYLLNNPGLANSTNLIDVVVSNPCGSVTSSPPVGLVFPTVFYPAYDAGAGFFGGENLIFTNLSGMGYYVWSSPDPTIAVTNWNFEGQMSEFPFGISGSSRYAITVNPVTSPVYYIFAPTNTGPYNTTEALVWLTTVDYLSFTVNSSNVIMDVSGYFFGKNAFAAAYDAGSGFFGGENLIFTNASGVSYYVWSSSNPSVSVTNWTLEGPMQEFPFGTSGSSRYGITLNPPASSLEYYIFATANTRPYTDTEAVSWLTTDASQISTVAGNILPISADGIFVFPVPPNIIQPPQSLTVLAGQSPSFKVAATGSSLGYQWLFNNAAISSASGAVLGLTNVSSASAGSYAVIVTNSTGAATSSVVTLTVVLPPTLTIVATSPGSILLTAHTITNLTYVVQTATNLVNPIWVSILTNTTGLNGLVSWQTNTVGRSSQFYRLFFPLAISASPNIIQSPQSLTVLTGQNPSFNVTATGSGLGYQWLFNNAPISGASGSTLNLTNVSSANTGPYAVIVTNSSGSITSSVATLTVVLPPTLNLIAGTPATGTLQLTANAVPSLTYVVQTTTNLVNPVWVSIMTNTTGLDGVVSYQTNIAGATRQFFRLIFP